jgi:hypothetical protein
VDNAEQDCSGENAPMAVLMTRCPNTGEELSTEIAVALRDFESLSPLIGGRVHCRRCACDHVWNKEGTWPTISDRPLREPQPQPAPMKRAASG